jgi:hypothetical protein
VWIEEGMEEGRWSAASVSARDACTRWPFAPLQRRRARAPLLTLRSPFAPAPPQDDSDASEGEDKEEDDAAWAKAVTAGKMSKGDKLAAVDHATIEYPPFRRNFYIEVGGGRGGCCGAASSAEP